MTLPTRRTRAFLLASAAPDRRAIALVLGTSTLASAAALGYPVLLQRMIERAFPAPAGSDAAATLLAFGALFAAGSGCGYAAAVAAQRAGFALRNRLRARLFASLAARDLHFHRAQRTGELSARAVDDVGRLQPVYGQLLLPLWQNGLVAAGCLAIMATHHPLATLGVVALLALPLPLLRRAGRRVTGAFASATAAHAHANAVFEETLAGIRDVKAFGRTADRVAHYRAAHAAALPDEMRAARIQNGVHQGVAFALSLVLLAAFAAGASRALAPHWHPGDAASFALYAYTMIMAVVSAGRAYLAWHGIAGALARTSDLLADDGRDSDAVAVEPSEPPRNGPATGHVELRLVSFAYPGGVRVLDAFSLDVPPGTWLFVQGASGSGKSTLAHVIAGLYLPDSGAAVVDGTGLSRWSRPERIVGFVPQDAVLFHGTLRENVAFAVDEPDDARARAVAEIACLEDALAGMPDGFETVVGERGHTVSGGQKARIALARALYADPAVLVLDEINAALEPALERELWSRLARAREGRTTIVLGHHGELLPRMDREIVLASARTGAAAG